MNLRPFLIKKWLQVGLVCGVVLFATQAFALTPGECIVNRLERILPQLSTAFLEVQKISPDLIRGEKTPGWNDFDQLGKIIDSIKLGKEEAVKLGKVHAFKLALRAIEKAIPDSPELTALKNATPPDRLGVAYEPGEYALKAEYQSLLRELNRELPAFLRIPGVRLPRDTRLPALVAQAEQMLIRQNVRFQRRFSLTGFASYEKLRAALLTYDDVSRKLVEDFESEKVEFAMRRPENARWWVPRVGFQNTRTVGKKNAGYVDQRDIAEAAFIGMDLESYQKLDDEFKVKNGYLKPLPEVDLKPNSNLQGYGTDIYIFKKDSVRNRLTWTSGNSLGQQSYAPQLDGTPAKNWHGFMVPWKYRLVAIPDLLENIKTNKTGYEPALPGMLGEGVDPAAGSPIPLVWNPPKPPQGPVMEELLLEIKPVPQGFPNFPIQPQDQVSIPYPVDQRTRPVQPMMPPLKPGQTYAEAFAELKLTPEYRVYEKKLARFQKQWNRVTDAYSAEVKRRREIFEASEVYQKYLGEREAIKKRREELSAALEQTQAWKDYLDVVAKNKEINERNEAKAKAWQETDEYKDYLVRNKEYQAAYQAAANGGGTSDFRQWINYNQSADPYFRFQGTPLAGFRGVNTSSYIELQYWGPIGLEEVEAFEFLKTPPEGEFLAELLKRGIQIRDGRVQPPVPWVPGQP